MTTLRTAPRLAALLLAAGGLSGCMGPTYGTDSSQVATLFDDLNNMVALGSSNQTGEIAYAPRPELVTPENTSVLPQPQQARNTTGDPNWPESPEQRAQRLQQEAYQGDGPLPADFASRRKEGVTDAYLARTRGQTYDFNANSSASPVLSPAELRSQRELALARGAEGRQGSPTQRRYLSEPPVNYRQPASSAPVGDVGVDESVKERRMRGSGDSLGQRIRNILPF